MPESDGNDMEIVEIAHRLDEAEHAVPHLLVEWIEAIILAVVAVTTAWSGYGLRAGARASQSCMRDRRVCMPKDRRWMWNRTSLNNSTLRL